MKPIRLIILTAVVALASLVNPSNAAAAEVVVKKVVDEGEDEEPAPVASTTFKRELAAGSMSMSFVPYDDVSMSYDYSGDYYEPLYDDYYDAKSSKKSAKTPKRANRGRALRECFLPFAANCRRGETCRRIRFRGSNGKWTTSGPARVRGVCVQNGRCFPRNVLQNAGGNRAPDFEELARNCCQPNRTKSWTIQTGRTGTTWAVCR